MQDEGQGDDDDEDGKQPERDPLDESFDSGEIYGVEGMTYHLLELLSSLVQRPNVQ